MLSGTLGCTNASQLITQASNSLVATNYDCSYFGGYDTLAACQSATSSTCTPTYETYPNGNVGNCYFPPSNYSVCLVNPPTWDWVYTVYTWCDTGTQDPTTFDEIYSGVRSVLGCSSSVCTCSNAQATATTCYGLNCSTFTSDPTAASPTPPPCE